MDMETETLKQLATILYNKTTENSPAIASDMQAPEDVAPLLRVPPETIQQQQTQETQPAMPEPMYHLKSQPKKQTNKHKLQCGKLAA